MASRAYMELLRNGCLKLADNYGTELRLNNYSGILPTADSGPVRIQVAACFQADLPHCPRCDQPHTNLLFARLQKPSRDWNFWVGCPVTGEPVLIKLHEE